CVSVSSIVPRRAPIVLPLGRVTGCDTISGSGKKGSPLGHASACASETLAPSATTRAGRATPQRRATARPNVITESRAADRAGTERRGCVRSLDMTSSLEWQWISYRSNEPAVVRHRRGSGGLARLTCGRRKAALHAGRRTRRLAGLDDDHEADLALVLRAEEADGLSRRRSDRVSGAPFVLPPAPPALPPPA